MSHIQSHRRALRLILALIVMMALPTPVIAEEARVNTGDVAFRMTLSGVVDDRDGFLVLIECEDEWCDDETSDPAMPDGKIVIFCGPDVADAPACAAGAHDFTVELLTGPMEYWFYRIRDYQGDSEDQLLHNGTWGIHAGTQTITMGYMYSGASDAGGSGSPTLPDTAAQAP